VITMNQFEQISFKILAPADVTPRYVSWLHDPQVIRYSDNQYRHFSLESQKKYVQSCIDSPDMMLWGVFFGDIHIGNVVLDNIDFNHLRSEVTYLLGDQNYWRRGIATHAVKHVIAYTQFVLGLKKLYAGVAEQNIASIKVLQKCGFTEEARREAHLSYNKTRMAQIDFKLILS